ncbi:MAG: tetratricopeptide repeat protein [Treponema sp.]|nr:tetratricopeptide repeat protein [Treponema sp.]MCL2237234.1 tetratricopeptide repeat protein [Treponema sp.]
MPSLSDLGQFKTSFNNIANEKADIESLLLPFDDLPLPTNEAPPFDYTKQSDSAPSSASASGGGAASDGADDFDFNSLINDVTDHPAPPPMDDVPTGGAHSALDDFLSGLNAPDEPEPAAQEDASDFLSDLLGGQTDVPADTPAEPEIPEIPDTPAEPEPAVDDFSTPDDLLSGFSDEMESSPADFDTDDLPLNDDDDEPESIDMGGEDAEGIDMGGESFEDFDTPSSSPAPEESLPDNFDMPDFDTGADEAGDLSLPDAADDLGLPDFPEETAADTETTLPEESLPDDFDMPDFDTGAGDSALPDVTDDLGLPDFPEETAADDLALPDFPEEATAADDFSLPDNDSIDMGGEDQVGGFGDGNIDMGGESMEIEDEFSMDGVLPDTNFDLPIDTPQDASQDALPDMSLDAFPEAPPSAAPAPPPAAEETTLDLGDLGGDFASSSIDLDSALEELGDMGDHGGSSFAGGDFGGDDFVIPGIDEMFNKQKAPSFAAAPAPKKGLFGKKKQKDLETPVAEDDVEEISLSQDEVDNLLKTLSSYPLNLRIACEELIAEQVILPAQLSKLIRLLVYGAHVKETAAHVESITGKQIVIPKSFEKSTGAAFEDEQSSFGYIFIHNFLPVLRLFAIIAALVASVAYLGYNLIYIPVTAESLFKRGYELIPKEENQRANDLFQQAFTRARQNNFTKAITASQQKKWFYAYAEAFRDIFRYTHAAGKYDELLRFFPRDKKGVLDYAYLNTKYIRDFAKANELLQRELLDWTPDDIDGLLAAGDNYLEWGDATPFNDPARADRYEGARFSYARVLELYGWQPPYVERMMRYFIRVDDLYRVLELRLWFEASPERRPLSAVSLAELGGYLLDKQLEKPTGVPNAYVEEIESVRDMLLKAVRLERDLPEPHYHLARYYHNLGNVRDEKLTLENAIRAFDLTREPDSIRRRNYRVDAHYRYANWLINNREFFPAYEQVVRGIELFNDFRDRGIMMPSARPLGQLYGLRGDLEYFVRDGNMQAAIDNYRLAEANNFSPPELKYRMGAAYYQLQDWRNSLDYLFRASAELPLNRRLLYALGNAAYQRGDHFAAQGYYDRLLDILENQRVRLPVLLPNENPQFVETGERLMMARNNAGVVYEALADQTGNRDYRARAMVMYAESARAWDAITRNPVATDPVTREPNPGFMSRMRLIESPGAPSINFGYLNANNALRPNSNYSPQIFVRIDRDVLEPSKWEELVTQ